MPFLFFGPYVRILGHFGPFVRKNCRTFNERFLHNMKTSIKIIKVKEIAENTVTVIKENGDELKLPISQTERFGNRVFIPTWLAQKIGGQRNGKRSVYP